MSSSSPIDSSSHQPSNPERRPAIFLVDDDDMVLSSMRVLFEMETNYELKVFNDPNQAIQQLQRGPVDVLISDYLMPGMNGIDLLSQAKKIQPDAVRILLTGFADKQNAIRGINEVGLYQYLEKPWDNQELLLVIRNALQDKNLRSQLREKVSALNRLIHAHRELAERHDHLEQELRMAAEVQQRLFPKSFPEIEGYRFHGYYRPSQLIGGDYYDFYHRDHQAVLLLSDVSGHGIQAALTSMLVKSIFQDAVAVAEGPEQLLTRMNERLHRFLPEGMFAAATVVWLDTRAPRLHLANAGLPFPFTLSGSERRLDEIPIRGIPLGLFGSGGPRSYEGRDLELTRGDIVLLASDGLGDVRNRDNLYFSDRELRQTLSDSQGMAADDMIASLIQRASQFAGPQDFTDDISLLAITKT